MPSVRRTENTSDRKGLNPIGKKQRGHSSTTRSLCVVKVSRFVRGRGCPMWDKHEARCREEKRAFGVRNDGELLCREGRGALAKNERVKKSGRRWGKVVGGGRWWVGGGTNDDGRREEATDGCCRGQRRLLPWPLNVAWPVRLLSPSPIPLLPIYRLRIAILFNINTPPRIAPLFLSPRCIPSLTSFDFLCGPSLPLWFHVD